MPARIRARYADGVLTPLDPVDLRDGVEVALAIDTAQPEIPSPPEAAERRRQTPDDAWDDVHTDFAKNKKRYLYGHPEEEEPAPQSGNQGGSRSWLLELVDELHRKYPDATGEDHPPDFVKNKKHYLYGHPKEED